MTKTILATFIAMFTMNIAIAQKPNIVLIMADDMGFSDIGCFGSEIPTPNLDKLAQNGVRFSQFYNTARCCPTRASLLTGLYQHQTGIGQMSEDPNSKQGGKDRNDAGVPGYQGYLNHHCITIAEALKPAGYHTYMAGKWHVGMHGEEKWPLQRGFEKYYGILAGACSYLKPEGGRGLTLNNTHLPAPEGDYYTTDAFTENAIRMIIEQKDDKPFFLYLAFNAPHWPLQAKKEDYEKFVGKYMKGWDVLREERHQKQKSLKLFDRDIPLSPRDPRVRPWSEVDEKQKTESDFRMAVYAAQVNSIDQNIGKLLETLKSLNKLENTLIVFLSDNGACAEPYQEFGGGKFEDINNPAISGAVSYGIGWANLSNTPFYEYKVKSYEGGISAPFIAYWPNKIKQNTGEVYHTPAQLIDLMPTFLEASGAKYPETHPDGTALFPLEGNSLLPAFINGKGKQRDYMFWEHQGYSAIRKGDWKAYKEVKENDWELYDLRTDRDEQINVAKNHPDLVKELNEKWYEWAYSHQVLPKKLETSSVSSPEKIKKALDAHNRAIHVKDGWIRDPYIVKAPDGFFFLTGTTQLSSLKETPQTKYNIGLGDSSLVGYELQAWKTKDFIHWESFGVPFTLKDGIWFSANPERFEQVPESRWRLWAPEFHFVNGKLVMIHTSPSPAAGANMSVAPGTEPKRPWKNPMGEKIGKRHDPSLFQDDDGTWWMIWGATTIAPLKPDLSGFTGEPVEIGPSGETSKMGHEGCLIRKIHGKYVLFGTGWSTGKMRKGSYNLYYATADKITGPYSERKFVGRFLGHGTPFQDNNGKWWCTAFFNANIPPLPKSGIQKKDLSKNAQTINEQGVTLVPLDIKMEGVELIIRAIDPDYAAPGLDEAQKF